MFNYFVISLDYILCKKLSLSLFIRKKFSNHLNIDKQKIKLKFG